MSGIWENVSCPRDNGALCLHRPTAKAFSAHFAGPVDSAANGSKPVNACEKAGILGCG
jgi:hypothetical protein